MSCWKHSGAASRPRGTTGRKPVTLLLGRRAGGGCLACHQSASKEQLLSGRATWSWDTPHTKQAHAELGRDTMRQHQVSGKEARILFFHVKQAKANLLYCKNIKSIKSVTVKPNEHDPGPSPCDLGSPSSLEPVTAGRRAPSHSQLGGPRPTEVMRSGPSHTAVRRQA